jgi:hypothetical protein
MDADHDGLVCAKDLIQWLKVACAHGGYVTHADCFALFHPVRLGECLGAVASFALVELPTPAHLPCIVKAVYFCYLSLFRL